MDRKNRVELRIHCVMLSRIFNALSASRITTAVKKRFVTFGLAGLALVFAVMLAFLSHRDNPEPVPSIVSLEFGDVWKNRTGSDDLNMIGNDVLVATKRQFKAEVQAHGAMHITEMTDTCKQFPLVGKSTAEANYILQAAGQRFSLYANNGPTGKPNELGGGFLLESDEFAYSAVFNIILHATKIEGGTIDAIVYCNVLTRSL